MTASPERNVGHVERHHAQPRLAIEEIELERCGDHPAQLGRVDTPMRKKQPMPGLRHQPWRLRHRPGSVRVPRDDRPIEGVMDHSCTSLTRLSLLACALSATGGFAWNLGALLPRLVEADCDRLLAALDPFVQSHSRGCPSFGGAWSTSRSWMRISRTSPFDPPEAYRRFRFFIAAFTDASARFLPTCPSLQIAYPSSRCTRQRSARSPEGCL